MDSMPARAAGPHAASLPPVAPLFDGDLELDALERMLLELAVHSEGAGAPAAWLVLWDARRGLLEGWRSATPGAEPDLAAALGRARRAAPGDGERRVRAWAEPPEALEDVLAEAWRGSTLTCGAAAAHGSAPWAGRERLGALALRRGPRAHGMIVVAWDEAHAANMPARLEWLRSLADAALFSQWRSASEKRRMRQAEALAEMARASVSPVNVAEVLHLLARLAAQATGVRGSAVYRARNSSLDPKVEVAFGPTVLRDACAGAFTAAAAAAIGTQEPRFAASSEEAPDLPPGIAGETSVWAALPLRCYGRTHGALVVYDGADRHPSEGAFERADTTFLAALADQAALLLEHAEAIDARRRDERRIAEQAGRLVELERMSAIGELAARVARESRNPIASISAFARRAQRELGDDDPQREYLEIVVREAERLEAMLREQAQYAQLDRPRLKMQALNTVVQEALMHASETLVRRRVRLLKKLAPDLPELLLDEHRIRRVVENVLAFALEVVPTGGRIRVESRRAGEWVALELAHDGAHAGGELLEQLFVPFAAGVHGGAAVGLAVAQQIVREHGGEVRVRSESEWATVFSFTLPIQGNQERRQRTDRRSGRTERRRRGEDRAASEGDGV
jgi:signal transduction histidine kinase